MSRFEVSYGKNTCHVTERRENLSEPDMLIPNQHATCLELRNEQELLPTERRDQSCEGFNLELKRIWN